MAYFQITAKVEEWADSSYTIESTGEIVEKRQLSLVVPGMRNRVLCELPRLEAPKDDILDKWELEETWVIVTAEGMRALGFERSNARAGERSVGAMVVFQASAAREVSADGRRALQQARKEQKARDKQRRAQRQAERQAARAAEKAAGGANTTPAQQSA